MHHITVSNFYCIKLLYFRINNELFCQVYKDNAGPAFSILKSVQSAASAIALAYTDKLELYVQIPMLMAMGVIGTVFFSYVDIRTGKREARSLKERGMELDEMEREKRPKPAEVQEAPTSKL